jgi:hypothetical protein
MSEAVNLQERLTPTHLIPETEEGLREEMDEAVAKIDEVEPDTDPRDAVEYTFNLEFKDGRGKVWSGKFVNHILTIRDRQLVGMMKAKLTGGLPFESVDPLTAEINHMVTHMTQSLRDRPDWAKNLLALTNYEILQAIYMEVDSHESHFHGRPTLEESGATKSD